MSKREDELLKFMSDDERESYEANQKKVKAARGNAGRPSWISGVRSVSARTKCISTL